MNRVILETFWSDTHLAIPFHSLWKIKLEVKCVTIGEEEFKMKLKIKNKKAERFDYQTNLASTFESRTSIVFYICF